MKPFPLIVNSVQSENFDDPNAPTRVVLVSTDEKNQQHVGLTIRDKADLEGVAQGGYFDLMLVPGKAPAPKAEAVPVPVVPPMSNAAPAPKAS